MIIFGKPANERIASAVPLYVQENVAFLVKTGTGRLADQRDSKTDKRMEKSKTKSFYFPMSDENLDTASEDMITKLLVLFTYIK